MNTIEHRLQAIEERNRKVETDKAWEVSFARRACIALFTYCTAGLFLWSVGIPLPFANALVPTGGYLLSTASLPWIKEWWKKRTKRP